MEKISFKELLEFQIRRHSSRYSKNLLILIEDLQKEHSLNIDRAKEIIPPEHRGVLDQLNILSDGKVSHIRKRILDNGGDFVRDMEFELKNYKVDSIIKG